MKTKADCVYFPMVQGSGTFVQEWQKLNGDFAGFKNFRGILDPIDGLWESAAGNMMARVVSIESDTIVHNLPAGIFVGYNELHPEDELIIVDGATWTLNPDVPFSYDPIKGISIKH